VSLARPPRDSLNALLRLCNSAAQTFHQPPLYASSAVSPLAPTTTPPDPDDRTDAFHVSIAWTLCAPSPTHQALAASWGGSAAEELSAASALLVRDVKAKIGNVVTSIALPDGSNKGAREALFAV